MTKSASRAARGPASPAATSSEPFDDGVAVAVALRGVSLFAGIDPDTFGWLRHRAVLERLPAGTRLSGHGDPQLHVAAIVSGSIEMGLIAPNGRQTLVSYLGPGQVIGLIAVFDGRGVVYDSQVSETCTLVRIAATDFREAVDRSKVLRDRVLRMLASRSRMLLEGTADFHTQPLPVRLARVLLSLGSAHGVTVPEQGVDIELKVSQERLARMLNVSRQRVNLELAALESKGLVQRGGYRRINLLDREALGRVAWSNPG